MAQSDVRVSVRTDRPVEAVWRAFVDPLEIAQWFGDMEHPWKLAERTRIDFADGDFFVATAVEIVDSRYVEFEWTFLDLGPVATIRWSVTALPSGAEIEIVDHLPSRTSAEVVQMVAGWTDFAHRLVRYLATGERTRYEWRQDIDGSIDLPKGRLEPLADDTVYRWLPIATDGFEPHWFFVVDDEGPRRFALADWSAERDELRFSVEIPGATAPTRCAVTVDRLPEVTRLSFSHQGWNATGLPDSRGRELRRRFAASWTAALREAGKIARGPHV